MCVECSLDKKLHIHAHSLSCQSQSIQRGPSLTFENENLSLVASQYGEHGTHSQATRHKGQIKKRKLEPSHIRSPDPTLHCRNMRSCHLSPHNTENMGPFPTRTGTKVKHRSESWSHLTYGVLTQLCNLRIQPVSRYGNKWDPIQEIPMKQTLYT